MVSVRVFGGPSAVVGVILLCCYFNFGEAISCYECNSHHDIGCDSSTPPDSFKVDCTAKYNDTFILCRKSLLKADAKLVGKKGEENRYVRSCAWDTSNYVNSCYRRTGASWQQETCSCSGDFCNTAPKISLTVATLGVLLLSVLNAF